MWFKGVDMLEGEFSYLCRAPDWLYSTASSLDARQAWRWLWLNSTERYETGIDLLIEL